MKSLILWTFIGGITLSVISAIFTESFGALPCGCGYAAHYVCYHRDPSGVTGVIVGSLVTLIVWMVPGLILRALYLILTPQEKY
ncbi:hypothetical protein [Zavarzinella formosa]|uniref:hypothetical protein n=1 Tax=Zavarzinella formosa TaxID=360055 RepID=UPI0002E38BF9|nr:hypothetical protein [Zavarzinella formosa]